MFCSTPNCEQVLNIKEAKNKRLTCIKCKKDTCSVCKVKYHGSTSCHKNLRNQYSKAIKGSNLHVCPNCGAQIEKNGGCPQMNCALCHHSWCWICGLPRDHWLHEYTGGTFCNIGHDTFANFN